MRNPRFGATILVVVILAVLGVGLRHLRPLIPLSDPNKLASEQGEFLRQGAFQPIDWLPMSATVFTEARRLDRPVLLVIGTPWSRIGRSADATAFSDPEVQMLLKRHFLCARVDGSREPNWLNAYLPFSRVRVGAVPDFQIWFLKPTGEPFDAVLAQSPSDSPDNDSLMVKLLEVRAKFRQIKADTPEDRLPDVGQAGDVALLSIGTRGRPSFDLHAEQLAGATDRTHGGYPNGLDRPGRPAYQQLAPQPLRFLLATGRTDSFEAAAGPTLNSPFVDRLDGGFFLRSRSRDWMEPEYDKQAVLNAELMQVFATAEAQLGKRVYGDPARATFDALADSFLHRGMVMACRIGDERRGDRSEHSSFPPRVLRAALAGVKVKDPTGREMDAYSWARDRLGLRVEDNPRMLIRFVDPALPTTEPEALKTVLDALRRSSNARPNRYAGTDLTEVSATVAARMLFCARLWNDDKRLAVASRIFAKVGDLVMGDDVAHGLYLSRPGCAYLGDYLAYADAALQHFLVTGNAKSFERGLSVLMRAKALFQSNRAGQWNMVTSTIPGAQMIDGPEIVDNVGESCTARVIRLFNYYGRLVRDTPARVTPDANAEATSMLETAFSAIGLFAPITADMGPAASGYFTASLGVLDDGHALVVGPDSMRIARALFRRMPSRLVSCCAGKVRRDLQVRAPGVYVVRGIQIDGPMSPDRAVELLGGPLGRGL